MRAAVKKILALPDVQQTFAKSYWATTHFRSGEEMVQLERQELAYWGPIVKASGFKGT
jgi:tripartite-type tricarboxylate transporter receptor subunit TctC